MILLSCVVARLRYVGVDNISEGLRSEVLDCEES